jgi:NAD(P)-dependent dehydrogenase (short-subunit alcohol dehydrogenase family)
MGGVPWRRRVDKLSHCVRRQQSSAAAAAAPSSSLAAAAAPAAASHAGAGTATAGTAASRRPQRAEFVGKVALVTGGSRGIGAAICVMLAKQGAKVAINFVSNRSAAEQTLAFVRAAGATDSMIVRADTSDPAAVQAMVTQVQESLGDVALLVNNAGIAPATTHATLDFATWKERHFVVWDQHMHGVGADNCGSQLWPLASTTNSSVLAVAQRTMDVNLHGPFLCTWAVKDSMVARGYGRIVNISSIAATSQPRPTSIDYATSKAALNSFTRHISAALAPHGAASILLSPAACTALAVLLFYESTILNFAAFCVSA